MKIAAVLILSFCISLNALAFDTNLNAPDWKKIQGTHFEIYYPSSELDEMPRLILRKAEEYYSSIADLIGYARYQNFWTWDARVKIIYYIDSDTYLKATGQPAWSKGFSVSHLSSFTLRAIVSFKGQENFIEAVLPHEIGHLILHDFIGQGHVIPTWFDEGVAQLNEARNDTQNKAIMAGVIANNKTIPLSALSTFPLKSEKDNIQVELFYAQSLYIVDFLIKVYGKDDFAQLCRFLRDGNSWNEALSRTYYPSLGSMDELQKKWFEYMQGFK